MQTPKFSRISQNLTKVLSKSSFKGVWKKKIRKKLNLSPLRDSIDNFDFHLNIDQRLQGLETKIRDGRYMPSPPKRYRVEKSKGLCRQLVYPSVEDCIVLQTLSDSLYSVISNCQPTKNAYFLPDDGAFNEKFQNLASSPYGSLRAWLDFQSRLFSFTSKYNYIVVTDIANYYDFIKFDQLRNVIASLSSSQGDPAISEGILDMLIFILSGLSWQPDYMPHHLTGLPQIDIDAPRLLAHCFLFEIDDYISNDLGLEHVRFMDDIDIGVSNIAQAKTALRDIDMIMQARQVRLNSGKTMILKSEEAYKHFCVRENLLLTKWLDKIDKKRLYKIPIERDIYIVKNIIHDGLKRKKFNIGNSEKILKRLLTTATKIGSQIDLDDIDNIIRNRPSARSNAFSHLGKRVISVEEVSLFENYINRNVFVDDISYFYMTQVLLESEVSREKRVLDGIDFIANNIVDYSEFGVVLASRLSAKFLEAKNTLHLIGSKRVVWEPDQFLGRQLAGIIPYFLGSKDYHTFRLYLSNANNLGVDSVFAFFDNISNNQPSQQVINYCAATNISRPLGANFEKIGMLIAISHNRSLSDSKRSKVFSPHRRLLDSQSFKQFFICD